MDILRFITAGSVDDGKSTLIGRLLYDTDSILADQLEALQSANRKNGDGTIDLAILTDGLKAEREQGITIDVAYKYFQTEKRKFIIADAPGHIQYTRNMVTGASNSDLAIILIDARKGVIEQTVRHSFLVSLLAIPHVVVCINKMDMLDYDRGAFEKIRADYLAMAARLNLEEITFIPVSALRGDNIAQLSAHMPWYEGKCLLDHLETVPVGSKHDFEHARMPVQWVIRPQTEELHDYRAYAGRVLSGRFKLNQEVTVLPSGQHSVIDRIELGEQALEQADGGRSVNIHLKDNIDLSRGDMLVSREHPPVLAKDIEADCCWMDTQALDPSVTYLLQHHSKVTRCKIREVLYTVDMGNLEEVPASQFKLNDIGRVILKTADALPIDPYEVNQSNGGAILIDSRSNLTVGALFFKKAVN